VSPASDDQSIPGLSTAIITGLRSQLPHAEKILQCLRTAAALILQAESDNAGLRLAECAAYNIREALNALVVDQDAGEGGLGTVLAAWQNVKMAAGSDEDVMAARQALDDVLNSIEANKDRANYYTRKMLAYLSYRAGIDAETGAGSLTSEYTAIRSSANDAVHDELPLGEARTLFDRTVAWLVRAFTPPDEVVAGIRSLAQQPWQDLSQINELRRLAIDVHHLRRFFAELTDLAWLTPLHTERVAVLPRPGASWPVAGLLNGLAQTQPERVAELLRLLLADVVQLPKDERPFVRFELLRFAVNLGPAGGDIVVDVARRHTEIAHVRTFAVEYACGMEPSDPIVSHVADAVLNHLRRFANGDHYYAIKLLDHLQTGVTDQNVAGRARMLAAKTHRAVSGEHWYIDVGIQALTVDPGERPELARLLAHHLVRLLHHARQLKVSASEQMAWLESLQGDIGDRVRCHVLAGADDIPEIDKIAHITTRLGSETATGDDLTLVADILQRDPSPSDLNVWTQTLGTPSAASIDGEPPRDWLRVWQWSVMLPDYVLAAWRAQIDHVTSRYGEIDHEALTQPVPDLWDFVTSPYTSDNLAELPVEEAAALIARWEPAANQPFAVGGPIELARALQKVVHDNPLSWTNDPVSVVDTLREPIYIEHYVRGLTEKAADVVDRAEPVLAAVARARADIDNQTADESSTPHPVDREGLENTVLDLVSALAANNADIATGLDEAWNWALAVVQAAPETDDRLPSVTDDVTIAATNRPWGHGIRTVLALATWESNHFGIIRADFEHCLDAIIDTPGVVGLEFRSVLVLHLPLLVTLARPWLDAHSTDLFRTGELGKQTLDLAVQASQTTMWFYENLTNEVFDAARRKVDNAADKISLATLRGFEGYDFDTVIRRLGNAPLALADVAEHTAFLAQNADAESPIFTQAVKFWKQLVDSDNTTISGDALTGLGRWAFVRALDDDTWTQLTARTLDATDGRIDYGISVADRVASLAPDPMNRLILLKLLDNGQPWERHHSAQKAIEVLRASTIRPADETMRSLRTRLLYLGFHEAGDIDLDESK
jgi:hypothetical protein